MIRIQAVPRAPSADAAHARKHGAHRKVRAERRGYAYGAPPIRAVASGAENRRTRYPRIFAVQQAGLRTSPENTRSVQGIIDIH